MPLGTSAHAVGAADTTADFVADDKRGQKIRTVRPRLLRVRARGGDGIALDAAKRLYLEAAEAFQHAADFWFGSQGNVSGATEARRLSELCRRYAISISAD